MKNLRFYSLAGAEICFGIFAIYFLSAGAKAQSFPDFSSIEVAGLAARADHPCDSQISKPSFPHVSAFQHYSQRRRDKEQEVLVVFCATKDKSESCPLSLNPDRGPFSPISLSLETYEGFRIRYRERDKYKSHLPGMAIPGRSLTFLKVRADKDVALGTHTLKGRLTFKAVEPKGSPPQEIDLTIPLTVADRDGTVNSDTWAFKAFEPRSHWWSSVRTIMATPILAPAFLLLLAGCSIADCSDL